MSHRIAICQPHYVPWIGYFEMIDRVDEFVFLDDVDVIMREWKTRNRIRKQRAGTETKWLTVPIERRSRRGTYLCDARIGGESTWRRKHRDALRAVYDRAPFFDDAYRLLHDGLARGVATLADLNIALVEDTCAYLGITTPLRRSSELGTTGHKTDKLVAVCLAVGADGCLANNGSAGYLERDRFTERRIEVDFQDYRHPTYRQTSGGEELPFLSHLSILDLIANHGIESLRILRSGSPKCAA